MIHVVVLYANTPGSRFDGAYYTDRHAPFARALLEPLGLEELSIRLGESSLDGGSPPFCAIVELRFATRAAFDSAMATCGETLFADIPNYTDIAPVLQICSAPQ